MVKRKKKATSSGAGSSTRSTVGGLGLKTTTTKKGAGKKGAGSLAALHAPASSGPTPAPTPSPFWELAAELRNNIYAMVYDDMTEPIKVVPKRPRSKTQKVHKCGLDRLLVCKLWFEESAIIFASSTEFQFDGAGDLEITANRLPDYVRKNITTITWRQSDFRDIEKPTTELLTMYPSVKRLRIVLKDDTLAYLFMWRFPRPYFLVTDNLVTDQHFFRCFGERELKGLLRLRGLETFSWVNEDKDRRSHATLNPLAPGRSVYQCNWDAFSEWVRKEVTKAKPEGT